MERTFGTSFLTSIFSGIASKGGMFNAHLHLDRAETLKPTIELLRQADEEAKASSLAIAQKHALIPMIHMSECYDPDQLEARVGTCVDKMAELGTTAAHTVVDVTTDRVGRTAMDRLLKIAGRTSSRIDFRVGAYSPLGFRLGDTESWALLEEAAQDAHFLGALPERDDTEDYPDHIGFDECCRRTIQLAFDLEKQIHIHVDQKNHDHESHAERVVKIVREGGFVHDHQEPRIWLIHVISPSAYDEERFIRLATDLSELNIGIICCPSAALSMRQIREIVSPTHNSIARVLEFLAAGVFVRLGTDNVCDITSPAGTLDVMDEIFVLANTFRYFDEEVLIALGAGLRISETARMRIVEHLAEDQDQRRKALARY